MTRPIHVTQPSLAPLEEFLPYLREIWESGIMTHNGPMLQRLERELAEYLRVPDVVCVANGTCAMQLALRALDLSGDIITTPFTFVATSNIIAWERCRPVFVDIDPETWNIAVDQIEAAITPNTTAILPVHVFSAPCDLAGIDRIAQAHGLKVIYDAAHAVGVTADNRSLLAYGDVSCASFHATKIFNTCEGGACVSSSPELMARIRRMRFFGFDERKQIVDDGMNAKMTEISAALGLANLPHLPAVQADRRRAYRAYLDRLTDCEHVRFQKIQPEVYNYSYMPILLDCEARLLRIEADLHAQSIFPRRYFYPAMHEVSLYGDLAERLPVASRVSACIFCLPLYNGIPEPVIDAVCDVVRAADAISCRSHASCACGART